MVDELDNSNDSAEEFGKNILGFGTAMNTVFGILGTFGQAIQTLGSALVILNSAGGVVGVTANISALGGAMSAFAGVISATILPVLAALSAAFATGFGIGTLVNEATGASDALVDWATELTGLNDKAADALKTIPVLTDWTEKEAKAAHEAAKSTKELADAHDYGLQAAVDAGNAQEKLAETIRKEGESLSQTGLVWDEATKSFIKATAAMDGLESSARSTDYAVDSMGNAIRVGAGTLSVIKNESKEVVEELKNINNETDEVKIAMLELASEERIKNIELAVDLKVAQVESDAKKVVAAYDSIAQTITSTNELVGKLSTSEAPEWDKFGFNLKKQIKEAEKRAKEAHEAQQNLINAQAKNLREQTKRIQQGEALIKIDSTGLEPHLDAFMWEILNKVRVRMAQNYQDFLLGNSCGGGS